MSQVLKLPGLDAELKNWQRILEKVPQLTYAGDKVLRTPCSLVTPEEIKSGQLKTWVQEMEKTLADFRDIAGYGRGLAANQIGISKQIIVTYSSKDNHFKCYINPQVVGESDEKAVYGELCLSFVLVMGDIVRPWKITIRYQDLDGKSSEETVDGIEARLLGHELSHLQGKMCLDEAIPKSLRVIRGGKEEVFQEKLKLVN
jgi:peptide deformylase